MKKRQVRSAKGEIVDFDLLNIKQQMATMPASTDVLARQNIIEKRVNRRVSKKTEAEREIIEVDTQITNNENITSDESIKYIDENKESTEVINEENELKNTTKLKNKK